MFNWVLTLTPVIPDESRDHEEADKKHVTLPGNASIQPESIFMVRSPSEDICILKKILPNQIENFTVIIYNSFEKKKPERLFIGYLLSYLKTNVKLYQVFIHFPGITTFPVSFVRQRKLYQSLFYKMKKLKRNSQISNSSLTVTTLNQVFIIFDSSCFKLRHA